MMTTTAPALTKQVKKTARQISRALQPDVQICDERKIHILYHLQKKRYMTISQLHMAVFPDCSKAAVYKAVEALKRQNMALSIPYSLGRGRGYQESLISLTKRGYNVLTHSNAIDETERFVEAHTLSVGNYAHRKACVDVWLYCERDLQDNEDFTLVDFIPEWRNKAYLSMKMHDHAGRPLVIMPDGAFIIRENRTMNEFVYFIEVDLKTERVFGKNNSLFDRFYRYQCAFLQKAFQKINGFQHFSSARMMFITKDMQRIQRMQEKVYVESKLSRAFLLTTFQDVEQNGIIYGAYHTIGADGLFRINSQPV